MFHSFKIDGYHIDYDRIIGKGQYGLVVECQSELESEYHDQLCAKLIEVTDTTSAQREASILKLMAEKAQSNKNIVQVRKVVTYTKKRLMGVVMEKCDTNLQSLLEKRKKFSINEVIDFLSQLLNGYRFLDNEKIIHRDLKPENILINFIQNKPIYKIADFGVGKIYEENDSTMTIARGTPVYAPPEINSLYHQRFGEIDEDLEKDANEICENKSSVDIYSIGLILHQLLFGCFPFEVSEKGIKEFFAKLKCTPFKVTATNTTNQCITDMIEKMIVYKPSKRITFKEIYEIIPYHYNSDFKKIENIDISAGSNSNQFFSTSETQSQQQKPVIFQKLPQNKSLSPKPFVNTCPNIIDPSPKINYFKQQSFNFQNNPQPQQSNQVLYQSDPNKGQPQRFQTIQLLPQQNSFKFKQINDENTRQALLEELKDKLRFLVDLKFLITQEVELRECLNNLENLTSSQHSQIQQHLQPLQIFFVFEQNRNYTDMFIRFIFLYQYFAFGRYVKEDIKKLNIQQQTEYLTLWVQ